MKKLPICTYLLLFFLFTVSFYFTGLCPFKITVDSSPPSAPSFNITRGSSSIPASPNKTSYWLSPSGIFAFGFYPLCPDCGRYKSFDYPTDTILSGQTLKTGQKLVSSCTLVMQEDGDLVLYDESNNYQWKSQTRKIGSSPIVLNLDSTGYLYLADWDGVVIKNLTKGVEDSCRSSAGHIIYRATLDPDNTFRLYEEKIGCEGGKSVVLWHSDCTGCKEDTADLLLIIGIVVSVIAFFGILCFFAH
ncbi:hypothetical protein IFM89_001306 [Coptis chinensis]|uniref:Bulb-type lectin domain-containing protein n=1 Tax=Coptis chinensis TaxID=261450 RepID=A0A835ISM3_9MAGN|nr:hypothetical protein IFM89_001306 [Coptis chinensis]